MFRMIMSVLLIGIVPFAALSAEVSFRISGLDDGQGQVMVAMFSAQQKSFFPKGGKEAFCYQVTPRQEKKTTLVCKDVPPGQYAAFAFYDANNNGEMDHNLIGLPKEKFGFSNGAKGSFGPPDFDDAVFSVDQGSVVVSIHVASFF